MKYCAKRGGLDYTKWAKSMGKCSCPGWGRLIVGGHEASFTRVPPIPHDSIARLKHGFLDSPPSMWMDGGKEVNVYQASTKTVLDGRAISESTIPLIRVVRVGPQMSLDLGRKWVDCERAENRTGWVLLTLAPGGTLEEISLEPCHDRGQGDPHYGAPFPKLSDVQPTFSAFHLGDHALGKPSPSGHRLLVQTGLLPDLLEQIKQDLVFRPANRFLHEAPLVGRDMLYSILG